MSRTKMKWTPRAWAKLIALRDAVDTEIAAWAISAEDDRLTVIDLYVPPQECSVASIEVDGIDLINMMDWAADNGIGMERITRIWCHTHPNIGANPSGTDESTFGGCGFNEAPWSVMFIIARGGEVYARLQARIPELKNQKITEMLDVVVDYSYPEIEGWKTEDWVKEAKEKAKKRTSYVYTSGGGSGHYLGSGVYSSSGRSGGGSSVVGGHGNPLPVHYQQAGDGETPRGNGLSGVAIRRSGGATTAETDDFELADAANARALRDLSELGDEWFESLAAEQAADEAARLGNDDDTEVEIRIGGGQSERDPGEALIDKDNPYFAASAMDDIMEDRIPDPQEVLDQTDEGIRVLYPQFTDDEITQYKVWATKWFEYLAVSVHGGGSPKTELEQAKAEVTQKGVLGRAVDAIVGAVGGGGPQKVPVGASAGGGFADK